MHNACQSVYDKNGIMRFEGEWDPRIIYDVLTQNNDSFWDGRTVLDIGGNTCGLSIEIARRGGIVTVLEPDPYKNTYALSKNEVEKIVCEENLQLKVFSDDLFSAHEHGVYDVVFCLGLLYHFRYPQFILDYLSTLGMNWLFISTQVSEGDVLALINRASRGVVKEGLLPKETILTGWHPTRPLMERMLKWSGFDDVVSLTKEPYVFPNKQKGLTNSAYYRAKRIGMVEPEKAKRIFYPR